MTRLLGVLALALLLTPRPAAAGDLTLRDVIELHRSGLGDELLVAVIEADGGPFQLSLADILDLRSDGLSERVIAALVRTGTRRASASSEAPTVQVQQHVTQVAPTVVIIEDDRPVPQPPSGRRPSSGFAPGPGQIPPMVTPPAATWTTRREDGRNVSSRGEVKSDKPAATWVTPRAGSEKASEGDRKPRGQ
jgi:hypothetical protein